MNPLMSYSRNGLALTQQFEQCRLTPYQDSAGVWTNGWGNTHDVVPHVPITQQQADEDLLRNVQTAVQVVNHYVTGPLSQDEFDALVDFVFNVGGGNFATSTLLRKLNNQDHAGAAHEFERWDMSEGKHLAGLMRRRVAEHALFSSTAPKGQP